MGRSRLVGLTPDEVAVIEVDGRTVGRPLIAKAPLLELVYNDAGGGRKASNGCEGRREAIRRIDS